jgi:hypothetical protein
MFQSNGTVGIGKGKYMVVSVSLDMTKVSQAAENASVMLVGSRDSLRMRAGEYYHIT